MLDLIGRVCAGVMLVVVAWSSIKWMMSAGEGAVPAAVCGAYTTEGSIYIIALSAAILYDAVYVVIYRRVLFKPD